jgi:hypothetical protein
MGGITSWLEDRKVHKRKYLVFYTGKSLQSDKLESYLENQGMGERQMHLICKKTLSQDKVQESNRFEKRIYMSSKVISRPVDCPRERHLQI